LGPIEANEEILRYAKKKNILNKINILPPASSEVIFNEEEKADVLILFEDLNRMMQNSEATLPGKLMEYLPFKAPIVAVNRADSEIGIVLKETSRGHLASNIKELNDAMNNILHEHSLNFDWEKIKKYSRESQTKHLCELLDKLYVG